MGPMVTIPSGGSFMKLLGRIRFASSSALITSTVHLKFLLADSSPKFLENTDHNRRVKICATTLHNQSEDARTRSEIEYSQVLEAINALQQEPHHHIEVRQGVIMFQRDSSRGGWLRHGFFRIGVAYAMDGSDLSGQHKHDMYRVQYIPLGMPNWFYYAIRDPHDGF